MHDFAQNRGKLKGAVVVGTGLFMSYHVTSTTSSDRSSLWFVAPPFTQRSARGRYQFIRFSGNVQDRLTNFRSGFFAQRPGFGDTAKAIGESVPAISERSVRLVRYPYLFFELLTIVDTRDTACQGGVPRLLAAVVADTASLISKPQFRCCSAYFSNRRAEATFCSGCSF